MRDEYVEQIVAFASTFPDTSYLDRQMYLLFHLCSGLRLEGVLIPSRSQRYVNICGAIVDDVSSDYFVETFLPHLIALAADKVRQTVLTLSSYAT